MLAPEDTQQLVGGMDSGGGSADVGRDGRCGQPVGGIGGGGGFADEPVGLMGGGRRIVRFLRKEPTPLGQSDTH